jgi:hypothetical protein
MLAPYGFRYLYFLTLAAAVAFGASATQPTLAQTSGAKPPTKAEKSEVKPDSKIADKVTLIYKAQAGQSRRSRAQATLNLTDPTGAKHIVEVKETGKTRYTSISASGDITYEDSVETSETTFDGRKDPSEDKKETNISVIRPNGVLVSYKNSEGDKDKEKFSARLYNATTPIFPAKPVSLGDKWSFDFKADDALGTRNGRADYEIVNADADTVKVSFSYLESGDHGITAKGFFVLEKSSGDKLSEDYKFDNVPLGEEPDIAYASGSSSSVRIEGGPLPSSKNAVVVEKKEEPKKDKTIDEVVKDYEKLPGFLTLYRKKETGKDTIYAEVKEDQIGKLMLLQTTASTGNGDEVIAGDPINDIVFKLTRLQDDRLVITIPNWNYQADAKTPMGKAVKRSFPDGYLSTFRIEARQTDRKSMLIDVSDFFRGDFAQISQALNGGGGGSLLGLPVGAMYSIDREKTYIAMVKSFPENVVVYTQYHFLRGGRSGGSALADPRSLPLTVVYNLFALPNDSVTYKPTNGFMPRRADGRVGYFTTEFTNLDDDSKEDPTVRYIQRWDLKKKDPNASLSDPVKPIVFWLDNAIPLEYRDAVKKGVLNWNKGFEKIGIKNALEVKQMPDDADWDHADGRYNIVRWVVTPEDSSRFTVAIALARTNPLTGQILSASVSVDAGWTRFSKLERRRLIAPAVSYAKGAEIGADIFEEARERGENVDEALKQLQRGAFRCEIGGDGQYQRAWMGDLARRMIHDGENPISDLAYTNQMLVETVTHEMGHIMGLRHNFVGSTQFTLEQLKNPTLVAQHGIGASVMDYNNFNISAVKAKGVDFYSQTIGVYDEWAIDYGYRTFSNSVEEASRLKEIASLSNMPGHQYQSDEQAIVGIDPRVTRFDMSAQTLDYWEKMLQLSRYLMLNLDKREPKRGESYWEFTRNLNGLINQYANAAGIASRHIGGVELNRNYKGDANERPTLLPVAPTKQKQALRLLNSYIFAPDALTLPERYYDRQTTDPFSFSLSQDFPVGDQIAAIKRVALTRLFSPGVLRRISNAEYKSGGNPTQTLTLPELFSSVTGNIWAELQQRKNISSQRRQLQRVYADTMTDMITKSSSVPDDAKMLARETLRDLKTTLVVARGNATLDTYTKLHIADTLIKIDRALNAQLTLGGSGGGAQPNLLQMLMGGKQ